MKVKLKLVTILLFVIYAGNAQVQLQSFVGNDGLQFSTIIQKDVNEKINFFNFTNYYSEYNNYSKASLETYSVFNFKLYKNLGIATGTTLSDTDITPQIGLSWNLDKKNLDVNLFPAINYSLNQKEIGYGIYSLLEYTPKISTKWNFYSMLILDSSLSMKEHSESNQYLRLGLEYNKKLQFGTGLNFTQVGCNFDSDSSYGVFIGYTL